MDNIMYWKTLDGKIHQPEEMAIVLTMDYRCITMETDKESDEHRMRDTAIEYGMNIGKLRIQRDIAMTTGLSLVDIDYEAKYRMIGLWIMDMIHLGEKKDEDKENENNEVYIPENLDEVKKKQKEYCI